MTFPSVRTRQRACMVINSASYNKEKMFFFSLLFFLIFSPFNGVERKFEMKLTQDVC